MENATDALIMAVSMFIIMLALSLFISSLTSVKNKVDDIVSQTEQIDMAQADDGSYLNYFLAVDDVREVSAETVVSSVRRVFKEAYTVYIKGKNDSFIHNISSESIVKIDGNDVLEVTLDGNKYKYINETVMGNLYKEIKGRKFKEYIGVYQTNEDKSSANKQTFRVITFEEI